MIAWLLARFFCWRRGHDWRLLTADLRYSGCHDCGAQKTNDIDDEPSWTREEVTQG